MYQSPLTPREKQLARRNYILFCGAAIIVAVVGLIGSAIFING